MRTIPIALLSLLLVVSLGLHGQKTVGGYNMNFGIMQPRNLYAKEAYRPEAWTFVGRSLVGLDLVNFQIGAGFEMFPLRADAASSDPMMDSIIKDNSGDPTCTTFITCGLEVGTPISFPVRVALLVEGDVGVYFGKSVYVMRQLRRDPMVHPIHWAAGFTTTARLEFRVVNNDDKAVFLFAQAGFRGHPGQLQKNRFTLFSAGVSIYVF